MLQTGLPGSQEAGSGGTWAQSRICDSQLSCRLTGESWGGCESLPWDVPFYPDLCIRALKDRYLTGPDGITQVQVNEEIGDGCSSVMVLRTWKNRALAKPALQWGAEKESHCARCHHMPGAAWPFFFFLCAVQLALISKAHPNSFLSL